MRADCPLSALGLSVEMADKSLVRVSRLLSTGKDNAKLGLSDKAETVWRSLGLSLAPSKLSGFQVCSDASPGCVKACISISARSLLFPNVVRSRVAKTRGFFMQRDAWKRLFVADLLRHTRLHTSRGWKTAVRLNVFSDIVWESVWPSLFAMFPCVQFYDYTKHANRALRVLRAGPANYHLTFSRSECNGSDAIRLLRSGVNVAVVFDRKPIPETWQGFPVVSGDTTDLRFLDPPGSVIGLYAKGRGKTDRTGFVVPTVEQSGKRIALPVL